MSIGVGKAAGPWGFGMVSLAVAFTPRNAAADCEERPPELVWSHPADGATEVPTDAMFFALGSGIARVELDGRALERPLASGVSGTNLGVGYELGDLEPNTTYSVEVSFYAGDDETETPDAGAAEREPQKVTVTFRTGTGAHQGPPPAVELRGISEAAGWSHFSEMCQRVIKVRECYDQGEYTHVLLNVRGNGILYAVSWDNGFARWPATCGDPSVFISRDAHACYTVHALDETGRVATSEELCGSAAEGVDDAGTATPTTDSPSNATDTSKSSKTSNCAFSHHTKPDTSWLLATLLFAARRRAAALTH